MDKKLLELAVEIVQAQVSIGKMSGEEIESVLVKVYNALHRMRRAEDEGRPVAVDESGYGVAGEREAPGKADPRASIQEDQVTCMECGSQFRQLTANHLRTHQLTPREYKRKWGFPLKQPLAARVLTKLRSRSAKKRGLPLKLQQYLEDQRRIKSLGEPEMHPEVKRRPRKPVRSGSAS